MSEAQVVGIMAYALLDRTWQHILMDDVSLALDHSRQDARRIIDEAQDRVADETEGFYGRSAIRNINNLTGEL